MKKHSSIIEIFEPTVCFDTSEQTALNLLTERNMSEPITIFVTISIIFLLAGIVFGHEIDPIFVPQRSFSSAVTKSMGDAGIALPSGLSAGIINPALVNVFRKDITDIHGSVFTGYGKDSLYNRLIITSGLGYSAQDGSTALFYRNLSSTKNLSHHEITLNLSGLLFPQSEEQGEVDFGMNLRYMYMNWKNKQLLALPVIKHFRDTSHHHLNDTSFVNAPESFSGQQKQSSLILDLGFFQPNIIPDIDFGLTLMNITGYIWSSHKPKTQSVLDTLYPDSIIIDSTFYSNEFDDSNGWIHSQYRTLAAGIAYHVDIKEGAFHLIFPLDIEILGLFDKKTKARFVFKGGIETLIANRFSIRLGYSRQPGIILKGLSEVKNLNFFTGGGGVQIDPFIFDFYLTQNAFGMTLSFNY